MKNLTRNAWLILAALALLGLALAPSQAHSAQFAMPAVPSVSLPAVKVNPSIQPRLPVRSIPGPTVDGRHGISLPGPAIPMVHPQAVFPSASRDGAPMALRLDQVFDNKSAPKKDAPAVRIPQAGGAPEAKPAETEKGGRLTLPEWELEEEIGLESN